MKKIILITSLLSCILAFNSYAADNNIVQADKSPPGLEKKGGEEFPRGLENKEKTPSGWSKGEKHHGHHHHHHHDKDHDHDRD